MDKEDYQNPFFEITKKGTKRSVKICLVNFFLDGFMRNFRRGSITDLTKKIFLKTYNDAEIKEEIKRFKNEVSEFAHYAKNMVYLAYGSGIRDEEALENTFKLDIYIGMALQELSDVFLKIVAKDKENKFSSETTRHKEVENEILKVMIKLVNSILDLIYREDLPPENILKKLEMSNIRKLKWLSMIICVDKNNEYCSKEVEFRRGEPRKYVIPADVDTGIVFKKGLNYKEGPQAVVGIKGSDGANLEMEFYLFDDFTSRRIKMLKKRIDNMFDKIVKQKDDPARLKLYEIELSNLREELILIVFGIEGEIKKIRRDYKGKLNSYGEYVLDENAIEVSKILHIKFIELLEEMRVLLLQYVNGGTNIEGLIIGYLEKKIALRECVAKEILEVDLSKCSALDFINDEIGRNKFNKFFVLKIKDPKLEEARNNYIKEKEKLEKYVSEEISIRGSVFDHLYVKFEGTDKYINPHDDFLFPGELEKHIRRIREMAEEKAKKEKDRNMAYKEACEEAIRGTVEECNYGEEMSFSEQLNRWKLNQKLLSAPDPKRAEKEWQEEVEKAKKEMPPDKVPTGEKINVNVHDFAPGVPEFVVDFDKSGLAEKNDEARVKNIHRISLGFFSSKSRLSVGRYVEFVKKLENSVAVDRKYIQKVTEIVEKVRPTSEEFQEYIANITIDRIERFLYKVPAKINYNEDLENAEERKLTSFKAFSRELDRIENDIKEDIEKIKSIISIDFGSMLTSEEDIESAIKKAREELEKLK